MCTNTYIIKSAGRISRHVGSCRTSEAIQNAKLRTARPTPTYRKMWPLRKNLSCCTFACALSASGIVNDSARSKADLLKQPFEAKSLDKAQMTKSNESIKYFLLPITYFPTGGQHDLGLEIFVDSVNKFFCIEDTFASSILLNFDVNIIVADFTVFLFSR